VRNDPSAPSRPVAELLGPEGPVAQALDGYEPRPQQVRMAEAVDAALRASRHLIVEAGTGVGKSFAYLVPALRWASETGGKVAVATSTIALQEQLVGKDLPALARALPFEVPFTLVKGRGNFVCRRRTHLALAQGTGLFPEEEAGAQLARIAAWADAGGRSLQDLPFAPRGDVWEAARAERGNCLHRACPFYDGCAYQAGRRRAHAAGLLVLNHHVLLADLALRRSGASFLPKVDAIVVDEAHDLEEAAAEHLGSRLTSRGVAHGLGRLWNERRKSGLLAAHPDRSLRDGVVEAREAARRFFDAITAAVVRSGGETTAPLDGAFPAEDVLSGALSSLARAIEARLDAASGPDPARELAARADALHALAEEVEDVVAPPAPGLVRWAEWGSGGEVEVRRAPVDVGPPLREALYDAFGTVVLTSATLSTGRPPSFAFVRERLGLADAEELSVGSPFDFARQARIVVRTDLPDPVRDAAAYEAALPEAVLDAVRRTKGGAFVLFTSTETMRRTAEAVRAHLTGDGLTVLVQGEELPRTAMLERFRAENAALFGVSSFWQGVDVPGAALRNVVIARLPFDVPTHPLQRARQARVEAAGQDPFVRLSLPGAAIRLKQGFGRLIRRATDRGIVVILDPRIASRRYGRLLLDALPECPVDLEPGVPGE
jgi:ATP-dependent DNA helicase DinG